MGTGFYFTLNNQTDLEWTVADGGNNYWYPPATTKVPVNQAVQIYSEKDNSGSGFNANSWQNLNITASSGTGISYCFFPAQLWVSPDGWGTQGITFVLRQTPSLPIGLAINVPNCGSCTPGSSTVTWTLTISGANGDYSGVITAFSIAL